MKLWNFRKKEESRPEVSETEQVMETSNAYRKRGNEILSELQIVRFPVLEEERNRFQPEKLRDMEDMIESCRSVMSNPLPSELDTSIIDDNIVKLVVQLRTALGNADEVAACSICKYVGKAILELRSDFERINELSIENELKSRALRAQQMVVLSSLQNQMFSLRETISQLGKQVEVRKEEYTKVYDRIQETKRHYQELAVAIEEGLVNKTKVSSLATEFNNEKARAVALHRDIENLSNLKAEKDAQLAQIEAAIHKGELVLLDSSGRVDSSVVQEITSIQENFQRQLVDNMNVMAELEAAGDKFQAMLDNYFNSAERLNRMIRTEMEFAEMEREKQKLEEMKRKGQMRMKQEEEQLKRQKEETLEPVLQAETDEIKLEGEGPQMIEI